MRVPKTGRQNFKVEVHQGKFAQRFILTRNDLQRRDRLAQRTAQKSEDISYQALFGNRRLAALDPPQRRTVADFFLTFCGNRQIDDGLVKKFPLLAAFLEEFRASASDHDLAEAQLLAKLDVPEDVICAAIYFPRAINSHNIDVMERDVIDCGLRLGLAADKLRPRLKEIEQIIWPARRARGVGLAEVVRPRPVSKILKALCVRDYQDSACKFAKDKEQILNLNSMMRNILTTRESKMLYAAIKLMELKKYADKKMQGLYQQIEKKHYAPLRKLSWQNEDFSYTELDALVSEADLAPDGYEKILEQEYMLQVIPIVEELNLRELTEKIKDAFFRAFDPLEYLKIEGWFKSSFGASLLNVERKLENVIRLVREVGRLTKLLPANALIKGRVKTPFSIYEKIRSKDWAGGQYLLPYDVLGLRIIVPDRPAVEAVKRLLAITFRSVAAALREQETLLPGHREPHMIGHQHCRPDCGHDGENPTGQALPPSQHMLLRDINGIIETKLADKGYKDGIKDKLDNKQGVAYYQQILTNYDGLPLEVQLTTRELEEENEHRYPHWTYKYARQLELKGLAWRGLRDDLKKERPGIYVLKMDEAECQCQVERFPVDRPTTEGLGEYLVRPGEYTLRYFIAYGWAAGKQFTALQNGYVLFKPKIKLIESPAAALNNREMMVLIRKYRNYSDPD